MRCSTAATRLRGATPSSLAGASGATIDHLSVTGAIAGIVLTPSLASNDVTISNNTVFGNYQHGVLVGVSNDRVSVVNNTLFGLARGASADNQVTGIQVASADGTISGNTAFDFQNIGIYVTGARAQVTGNTVYRGGLNSFGISGVGIQAVGAAGGATVVSGNTVFNNAVGGIIAGSNVVATGNTVYGHTGAEGIYADNNARVTGNTVFGNFDGITTGFGTQFVSGNRVYNNSRYGLTGPTAPRPSGATPSTPTAPRCR